MRRPVQVWCLCVKHAVQVTSGKGSRELPREVASGAGRRCGCAIAPGVPLVPGDAGEGATVPTRGGFAGCALQGGRKTQSKSCERCWNWTSGTRCPVALLASLSKTIVLKRAWQQQTPTLATWKDWRRFVAVGVDVAASQCRNVAISTKMGRMGRMKISIDAEGSNASGLHRLRPPREKPNRQRTRPSFGSVLKGLGWLC